MGSNKHPVLGMHACVTKLEQLGSTPSKGDTSLFYYNKGKHTMFVLVYVDDIIIAISSQEAIDALLKDLERELT